MAGNTVDQYRAAIGLFYATLLTAKFPLFGLNFYVVYFSCYCWCQGMWKQIKAPVPKHYYIDAFHLNSRSIRNYQEQYRCRISLATDFDLMCFTETHFDANILYDGFALNGFDTIFRKDRNCFTCVYLQFA